MSQDTIQMIAALAFFLILIFGFGFFLYKVITHE